MKESAVCEYCYHFTYDYDYECYICAIDLDEDEMYNFLKSSTANCPYFKFDNEYATVHKQI